MSHAMKSRPVIEVEGLGKEYVLGTNEQLGTGSFREMLTAIVTAPFYRLRRLSGQSELQDRIWALKDVSFSVNEGDVVGIIGRNGAGKSTLLKVLARITAPTKGRVRLQGRVASLLEVGTGFHLELTGRENIFLNGAILGMSGTEIRRKLDEIIDFSGMEQFLDTPAKRYSSGMLLRLAFAVAAHLEPEILLVDEVLTVGDAEFQRKCLGKMDAVAKSGRTILFVSHNLAVVGSLCPHVIWIDKGQIREAGPPAKVLGQYMSEGLGGSVGGTSQFSENPAKPFQLTRVQTINQNGIPCDSFSCDEPVLIECECRVREAVPGLYGYMAITKSDGILVMVSDSYDAQENPLDSVPPGCRRFRIVIPERTLAAGEYFVLLNFTSHRSKVGFNVDSPGTVARFRLDDYTTRRGNSRDGCFSTRVKWTFMSNEQVSPSI